MILNYLLLLFTIRNIDRHHANVLSYKYLDKQSIYPISSFRNNNNLNEDIIKNLIYTSDDRMNKKSGDKYGYLKNGYQDMGIYIYEESNKNTTYIKNIIINPDYYHKYKFCIGIFIDKINEKHTNPNLRYLSNHLKLEFIFKMD